VAGKNNKVKVEAEPNNLVGEAGNSQTESWYYSSTTGQFIVNSLEPTNNKLDDATVKYHDL
jgi:hypothetical protein